jgi:ribosomal protein L11 methyltransferase
VAKSSSLWRVECLVPRAQVDAFAEALSAHCDSVSWRLADDQADAVLTGFTPEEPEARLIDIGLAAIAEALGLAAPRATVAREQIRDWVVESQASFPPVEAGPFFIHGSHIKDLPPAGRIVLLIDAGPAFGSGEHGTTKGCLLAVARLARRPDRPRRVLDMGCGSGVLAMAAAKAIGAQVLACDVDPRSVASTEENARKNRLGHRIRAIRSDGYKSRIVTENGPYDLILSNILARPLMRMAPDLARNLAPGGTVVLSGFVPRDAGRVLAAHQALGLRLMGRSTLEGWTTLVLRG